MVAPPTLTWACPGLHPPGPAAPVRLLSSLKEVLSPVPMMELCVPPTCWRLPSARLVFFALLHSASLILPPWMSPAPQCLGSPVPQHPQTPLAWPCHPTVPCPPLLQGNGYITGRSVDLISHVCFHVCLSCWKRKHVLLLISYSYVSLQVHYLLSSDLCVHVIKSISHLNTGDTQDHWTMKVCSTQFVLISGQWSVHNRSHCFIGTGVDGLCPIILGRFHCTSHAFILSCQFMYVIYVFLVISVLPYIFTATKLYYW